MNEEQTVMAMLRLESKIDAIAKQLDALASKIVQIGVRIDVLAARVAGEQTPVRRAVSKLMTDEELDAIDEAELEGWKRAQLSKEV